MVTLSSWDVHFLRYLDLKTSASISLTGNSVSSFSSKAAYRIRWISRRPEAQTLKRPAWNAALAESSNEAGWGSDTTNLIILWGVWATATSSSDTAAGSLCSSIANEENSENHEKLDAGKLLLGLCGSAVYHPSLSSPTSFSASFNEMIRSTSISILPLLLSLIFFVSFIDPVGGDIVSRSNSTSPNVTTDQKVVLLAFSLFLLFCL